eukprot:11214014-Lingulodinium_polyedra.AAC.1
MPGGRKKHRGEEGEREDSQDLFQLRGRVHVHDPRPEGFAGRLRGVEGRPGPFAQVLQGRCGPPGHGHDRADHVGGPQVPVLAR